MTALAVTKGAEEMPVKTLQQSQVIKMGKRIKLVESEKVALQGIEPQGM